MTFSELLRNRLEAVEQRMSGSAPAEDTNELLLLLDEEFAAPTLVSKYNQFEQARNELAFDKGVLPSQMLFKMYQLVKMRAGTSDSLVWEETRGQVASLLEAQAVANPILRMFTNQISLVSFANSSYEEWLTQFKSFEDSQSFRKALK